MNPANDWWLRTARDFFARNCEGGGMLARMDGKHPYAVVASNNPEAFGRMVVMIVAVHALGLRQGGKVSEDTIKRICQTIGEVVFKAAYTTSQNLTIEE